jgi:hypothetical protein
MHVRTEPSRAFDPKFAIIRVYTNALRGDLSEPKNKYAVDVEVAYGVFAVQVRELGRKIKLPLPLIPHPAAKTILKDVTALMADLASRGIVGQGKHPAVYEINPESPGAAARTAATIEWLRQGQARGGNRGTM